MTFLISYFILKASKYIQKLLGEIFLDIVSRMMGIVIMALAVQFIVKGIKQNFFPILH
ncbi:MarC family protein [Sulfurihydrogenibium azorense]|uniref:MarC family protein n=1 Tax=Sulfurihydrogenibium azorense TaxID=309806 RepID=UPI003918D66D